MENLHIEQIRPELTWRLRREVLYPAEPLHAMEIDEDNDGIHFGTFYDDQLVAVVSLFRQGNRFQFRKFAVVPFMQHRGVGQNMLRYVTDFASAQGGTHLWCNARVTALGFYAKAGFRLTGKCFSKNGFDYEIMEKILL